MATSLPVLDFAPWRLSGVVYGTLMNDPRALAALGEAVHQVPYKAPPKAPVLYLKPRNTLAAAGDALVLPKGWHALEIGASLGMVIGRTACRLIEHEALNFVAGFALINDVCLPHDSYYRPSLRLRARDGYCPVGPVVARATIADPDDVELRVFIDGALAQTTRTRGRARSAARLLADVTEFMTLQPGDILTLGTSHGAPLAGAGQHVTVEAVGVGRIENPVVGEEAAA